MTHREAFQLAAHFARRATGVGTRKPVKWKAMKSILLALLLLTLVMNSGCTKISHWASKLTGKETVAKSVPEDVVKQFVELSAGAKSEGDRIRLQAFCSGEMRRAFERMPPDVFKISYLSNNIKIRSIQILENSIQGDTAKIHYKVEIDNNQGTDPTHEVNEREVELVRAQGDWLIDAIRPRGSEKIAFTRGMIF